MAGPIIPFIKDTTNNGLVKPTLTEGGGEGERRGVVESKESNLVPGTSTLEIEVEEMESKLPSPGAVKKSTFRTPEGSFLDVCLVCLLLRENEEVEFTEF